MEVFIGRLPVVSLILAVLTLFTVIGDAVLISGNQKLEAEVQARQQFINQSQQITQVSNALIQALASAAIDGKDAAIQDLLTDFGITVSASQPAASAPEGAKPAAKSP